MSVWHCVAAPSADALAIDGALGQTVDSSITRTVKR